MTGLDVAVEILAFARKLEREMLGQRLSEPSKLRKNFPA